MLTHSSRTDKGVITCTISLASSKFASKCLPPQHGCISMQERLVHCQSALYRPCSSVCRMSTPMDGWEQPHGRLFTLYTITPARELRVCSMQMKAKLRSPEIPGRA